MYEIVERQTTAHSIDDDDDASDLMIMVLWTLSSVVVHPKRSRSVGLMKCFILLMKFIYIKMCVCIHKYILGNHFFFLFEVIEHADILFMTACLIKPYSHSKLNYQKLTVCVSMCSIVQHARVCIGWMLTCTASSSFKVLSRVQR
jgi:hypothetical protein